MRKKVIWLLAAMLLFLSFSAIVDNMRASSSFQYTVNDNSTATIVLYTGEQRDMILPKRIDGYVITAIGPYAFYPNNVLEPSVDISVTLPDTVTPATLISGK